MCLNKLKLDLYKLITVYSNSIVSFDDISIDQFFGLFFFTQHVITCISSRVPLYCIMIDQNTLSKCPVRCTPWLPWSISLLKLPSQSQIMPARSINNKSSSPVIKEIYPW